MTAQTPAQKRAKQKLRKQKTRAYNILKAMAAEAGMTFEELANDVDNGALLLKHYHVYTQEEMDEAIILREASETPQID